MPKILGSKARGRKKVRMATKNGIGHSALHACRREDISDLYRAVYTVN
jgi:hypothetical protein